MLLTLDKHERCYFGDCSVYCYRDGYSAAAAAAASALIADADGKNDGEDENDDINGRFS